MGCCVGRYRGFLGCSFIHARDACVATICQIVAEDFCGADGVANVSHDFVVVEIAVEPGAGKNNPGKGQVAKYAANKSFEAATRLLDRLVYGLRSFNFQLFYIVLNNVSYVVFDGVFFQLRVGSRSHFFAPPLLLFAGPLGASILMEPR